MIPSNSEPTFNLWNEAWITLEHAAGPPIKVGIEQALLEAHQFTAIYNFSPLAVVSIHRLLVAILQASFDPQKASDLRSLWQDGQFPSEQILNFGKRYANRFDLFSVDKPFLQSGNLPPMAIKGDNSKTVAYLITDTSPLTAIDHYRHNTYGGDYFCPSCLAVGLLTIPSFTGIGGRSYKTSINGMPPLYVIPVGRNLFESLVLSLLVPTENYWPNAASRQRDMPWWEHPPIIEQSKEVIEVGYLHSLTFPARQVRLHPEKLNKSCTRCGQLSDWGVQTMVFEMGEYRPKDAAFWMDPFVPYHLPDEGKTGLPKAVLPDSGKALWREFAGLFLYPSSTGKKRIRRPAILDRIANQSDYAEELSELNFRCVGVVMSQAKALEWLDASIGIPISLINDPELTFFVQKATQFAEDCANEIARVFRSSVNPSRHSDRYKVLKDQMLKQYWGNLSGPFRDFFLLLAENKKRSKVIEQWINTVSSQAQISFNYAISQIGEDARTLRQQEEGKQTCLIQLSRKRKKFEQEMPYE